MQCRAAGDGSAPGTLIDGLSAQRGQLRPPSSSYRCPSANRGLIARWPCRGHVRLIEAVAAGTAGGGPCGAPVELPSEGLVRGILGWACPAGGRRAAARLLFGEAEPVKKAGRAGP
ncbi:MAG: hypothetical protein ACLUEK_07625 [Oscillospiraceae bacterium]